MTAPPRVQPSNQSFDSSTHVVGGKTALRLGVPLLKDRVEPYGEVEGKTAGWVFGQPYLDANVTGRIGIAASL